MYYKVVKWRRQKYREGARLSEGLNLSSSRVGLWGGFVAAMQAPADPSREASRRPRWPAWPGVGTGSGVAPPGWGQGQEPTSEPEDPGSIRISPPWECLFLSSLEAEITCQSLVPHEEPHLKGHSEETVGEWQLPSCEMDCGRCLAFSEFPSLPFLATFSW